MIRSLKQEEVSDVNGEAVPVLESDMAALPPWGRVFFRILFREGPITLAMLVMLGVILGLIPSPYLGVPLAELRVSHERQLLVLEEIRDDLRLWQRNGYQSQPRSVQP